MATFQQFTWPPISVSASNPSIGTPGSAAPSSATTVAGEDGSGILRIVKTDASGQLIVTPDPASQTHVIVDSSALPTGAATEATLASAQAVLSTRLAGSFVPSAYDSVALTYVPSGNGVGQVQTAVYKLATTTVKTLTLSYDSSNRLSGVVAS